MSMSNGHQIVSKDTFIAGSFELFVKQQALEVLSRHTSVHKLGDELTSQLNAMNYDKRTVPTIAVDQLAVLQDRKNPVNDPSIMKKFDFAEVLNYYDVERPEDSFDINRAVNIALLDSSEDLAPFRNLHENRGEQAAVYAMADYLTKSVNQEIAARVSEVAMSTCLDMKGLSMETSLDAFDKNIAQPLENMQALQNDLAVGLTAMHQLKTRILTDYSPSNMEFLSKYGRELANSDLSMTSLNNLTANVNQAEDALPLSVAQLQHTSIVMMDSDYGKGFTDNFAHEFNSVRLPSSEFELASVLARENVRLDAPQFEDAVLMAKLDISQQTESTVAFEHITREASPKSLAEVLGEKLPMEHTAPKNIDSSSPNM